LGQGARVKVLLDQSILEFPGLREFALSRFDHVGHVSGLGRRRCRRRRRRCHRVLALRLAAGRALLARALGVLHRLAPLLLEDRRLLVQRRRLRRRHITARVARIVVVLGKLVLSRFDQVGPTRLRRSPLLVCMLRRRFQRRRVFSLPLSLDELDRTHCSDTEEDCRAKCRKYDHQHRYAAVLVQAQSVFRNIKIPLIRIDGWGIGQWQRRRWSWLWWDR